MKLLQQIACLHEWIQEGTLPIASSATLECKFGNQDKALENTATSWISELRDANRLTEQVLRFG